MGSAEDVARLREVLAALEAKQRLVELLNAYIDARQEWVRVVFDLEEHAPEMAGLVLIAAPARMAGESRGTVGVIGPKRMHYENTMNAVSYIAQVSSTGCCILTREVEAIGRKAGNERTNEGCLKREIQGWQNNAAGGTRSRDGQESATIERGNLDEG